MNVSSKELADILNISTRQLSNLVKEGILLKTLEHYDLKSCVQRYIDYKLSGQINAGEDLNAVRARKELAYAIHREFSTEILKGKYIALDQIALAVETIALSVSQKLHTIIEDLEKENLSEYFLNLLSEKVENTLNELKDLEKITEAKEEETQEGKA